MRYIGFTLALSCFLLFQKVNAQVVTTGFNHVGLAVSNLDSSAYFYREVLGLKPVALPFGLVKIRAWFEIGPTQQLHLLAGRTTPVANNDPNGAHFSLTIASADDTEAFLKKKGLKYLRQERFDGAKQIYITDPDGYVIELNEPKKE